MLKMYHKEAHAGSTPDFWEESWRKSQFKNAIAFCGVDPLRSLFEKYSKPGSLMLEGGCGMGQYLAYYSARGRKVIGLDFAFNTLKELHAAQEHLPLACGDVSRLPFADETFDVYYSGGVVEHFEGGAEASLSEARRVLKKDGVLLISVPYFSPLRTALLPVKRKDWRTIEGPQPDTTEFSPGKNFFQYAYRKKEFSKMLTDAGLKISETVNYSVMWGLYEIPGFSPGETAAGVPQDNNDRSINVAELIANEKPTSLLKRLVISEDDSIPVAGLFVKFMRWSSANLVMYVCTR